MMTYVIYDLDDNLLGHFNDYMKVYPGDEPLPYRKAYRIDPTQAYEYEHSHSNVPVYCENDTIGCRNDLNLVDRKFDSDLWLHTRIIASYGDRLIQTIRVKDLNQGVYDYTREVEGKTCEQDWCSHMVHYQVYSPDGKRIYNQHIHMGFNKGAQMPVKVVCTITEDTVFDTQICDSADCWQSFQLNLDHISSNAHYRRGETMYLNLTFVETDRKVHHEFTYESEVCLDINGCSGHEVTYVVMDGDEIAFTFEGHPWRQDGDRFPYHVTLTLHDVTIDYRYQWSEELMVCEQDECRRDVWLTIRDGQTHIRSVHGGTWVYAKGEKIVHSVLMDMAQEPFATYDEQLCTNHNGCLMHTNHVTLLDSEGNLLKQPEDSHQPWLLVQFKYGDLLPNNDDFEVTYQVLNVTTQKERLPAYRIFNNIHAISILEENLFFIPRSSWERGQDNVILQFNPETRQYRADYTNLPAMSEIVPLGDGFVGINNDKTAILYFERNDKLSVDGYHYYDIVNLTEGKRFNAVNNLIVDFDGTIYFDAVDNFIQDITGIIHADGTIEIDTTYTEREIIRLRPIN